MTSTSFTECFSAKSYLKGDTQTYVLNLVLIPFEYLDSITTQNLCKIYLDSKSVAVKLHFKDVSFPRPGEPVVGFQYTYNAQIQIPFQLSKQDYTHIMNQDAAMYELGYDVNLVKLNASVSTITHTKLNATNCFSNVSMQYRRYSDVEIQVHPLSCVVPLDEAQVFFQYFANG